MATRTRTVTCSCCGELGHNRRTCWMRNVTRTRGGRFPGDLPVWDPAIEDLTTADPIELLETPPPAPVATPLPAPKKRKRTKTPKPTKPFVQEENLLLGTRERANENKENKKCLLVQEILFACVGFWA